ncbi:MAG: efflux RND transporter permease subunit [Gemmatimonadota bacterium]|nr:efflux RND transporter permease subunit [Gemmatimonadota bacterium]MDH3478188.1 efflux RND transporter permease subunit [Gemmatimonadota bacterium]
MSIPSRSVSRPVAVAMLFLAVVFLGLISFFRIPIDLLPDVAYPRLVVYTPYPDVGPAEVERFVSEPIERGVSRVSGVERVESVSREAVSLVTVRFSWGTDMDFAALNVREQLDNLRDELPELAGRPIVLRTDPNSEPVMAISVSGSVELGALKDLAESVFKRRLEQIDGVAEAALAGGLEREIHVEVDPRLLETYEFTVQDVLNALAAANQSAPGGTILRGRYRYALRTLGEFQTVDEIAAVPLGGRGGAAADTAATGLVTIGDVARVEDGFKDRESVARYNGTESVGLLLFKESGANTVRVAEEVARILDQLRAQYPDLRIDVAMSQAGFITEAISNVVQALVYGGILAFLVLFLFLRDPRYPIAVSLAIPISVVATFSLLDLAGVSLNIMSLGGLALGVGMLVDNSIVVLENVFRHREEGRGANESAVRGAEEVQGAITASTLTTISVFGPIIYVEGVAGELFGDLSFAVAFALLASLLVALTLLPTMAARWAAAVDLRGATRLRRVAVGGARLAARGFGRVFGPFLDWFDGRFAVFALWYHGMLERALAHRGRVVAVAVGLLLAGVALGALLERDVLPDVDQGAFTVRLDLPRGTPLEETTAAAARVEAVFLADPDVDAVFTRVGRQEAIAGVEDDESGLHTAALEVRLHDGAHTAVVLARTRPRLASAGGAALSVETGGATALGRLLGGSEADLAVRVRGEDLDAAYRHAQAIGARLQSVQSLTNVRLGTGEGQPEIRVEIDRERAAAYGVEPRLIATTVEQYMRGEIATDFLDFDEKIPVLVRLPESERRSLETLRLLRVNGIPLRELVNTHEEVGPSEIRRLEQARIVTVFADVAQGGLDGAVGDVRSATSDLPVPRGLRVEIGGANEERDRSFRDLAFAFGLALLLVYMILAAQFESFVHPFTILLSVPLATIGASVALMIAGEGLNTMSLIGLVILVGIVVNDAIVKVDFINQMRKQGLELRQAILEAGRVRLRPIVMTTVTTVLGLTPMALGIGRGADLRAPLAIAVIGGLISATALTLIVVPVAYDLLEEARGKLRALAGLSSIRAARVTR